MQLTGVKIDLKCQECKQLSANYSISYVLYAAFFSSHQSSSLIAAINCDVAFFCAISACRFVRVVRIWVLWYISRNTQSRTIVFCRVSPKELVFKLEGTNGILHQNCIPICSFWPILI
ncbi:hypothetical protein T08_7587 [Trichinella sp. T8]|nr:hypothetical protein T08_7587 [Trichinella sp. T8]